MRLRGKFTLMFIVACVTGLGLATALSYRVAQQNALGAIEQETALIRGSALAVRAYTSEQLLPLLRERSAASFVPHTIPSFAAQSVFATFRDSFPEYSYKEAALNPTNPRDLAAPWEAELINRLRDDPELERISLQRSMDGERFYTVAYPITVSDEACLSCHSTPDRAPPAMVASYGSENGFGWQLDETIGAQIISVPMSVAEKRILDLLLVLVAGVGGALLIVLILTNLVMTRMVIVPVKRMSDIAEKVSLGDNSVPEYERPGNDEVASLSRSFNRMRRSLDRAMKMLE